MFGSVLWVKEHLHELEPSTAMILLSGSRSHVNVNVIWLVKHCGSRAGSPFLWSSLWDSSWWWQPALWHHGWSDQQRLSLCAELCNKCGCWEREDVTLVTLLLTSYQKTPFVEISIYLDGYCSVFRFQPFDVSALDKRKISNSLEPIATTDTSGFPNTNTPFILLILSIQENNKHTRGSW